MLGTGEILRAAPEERSFTQLLRFLLGFGDKDLLQIAEVLAAGGITLFRGCIAIEIPQFYSRRECGTEADIGITMLGAPDHRLGANHAGNPDRRMRFLVRQRPRIHKAIGEMLTLPSKRSLARPGSQHQIVSFVEVLAIV